MHFEIQLRPFSAQFKETRLMAVAHVVVGIPQHGRGAHLENWSLALYGRGRTCSAQKGVFGLAGALGFLLVVGE